MLSGLNQKGKWSGTGAPNSPVADGAPPAERHDLTPGSIEKVNEVIPLSPRDGRLPAKQANVRTDSASLTPEGLSSATASPTGMSARPATLQRGWVAVLPLSAHRKHRPSVLD